MTNAKDISWKKLFRTYNVAFVLCVCLFRVELKMAFCGRKWQIPKKRLAYLGVTDGTCFIAFDYIF